MSGIFRVSRGAPGAVLCAVGSMLLASVASAASSPTNLELTDPASITAPANPAARPVPIDDLYFTRSINDPAWSPDGTEIVFVSDMTGRRNLWKVDAAGGWPVQLVQSDERQTAAVWSPNGKWIVYQQDTAGDELWNLYAVPSNGGVPDDLTKAPEMRHEAPHWSPDGASIAFNSKPKSGRVYDVAILDWKTRAVRLLTHEQTPDHSWRVVAFSPDGQTLYADRTEVTFTDSDIYSIDVRSGAPRLLTPHKGKVYFFGAKISPDGRTLLVGSNQKRGFHNVALIDIGNLSLRWLTDTDWKAAASDFSPDGQSVTYTINADGRIDAFMADVATGTSRPLEFPPGINQFAGNPSAYAAQGDRLLLMHESSVQPADLWVYDLRTRSSRQLTVSSIASLAATPLAPAQIIHYRSFDGRTISALLWMPFNVKRDGSNPVIVLPHGGPTSQSSDYWSPRVAAFVSRGYICIAPNVRGSTGYGAELQKANYKDLGGGDLQDEIFAVKFLQSTGYVDAKRIGIAGGSYGGYMTLMALAKTPEVWAAGVESYGIINWKTMLLHEDPQLQEYEKSLLGDPVKDARVYDNASPLTFIHGVKAPLLVLQGEQDPRVPKEEAEQVVDLLRKDGKTVDVHYYPNEGHGFAKRENQIDAIKRTLDWFDRYLNPK